MEHFSKPYTYAVWTKDSDVRFKSTSGGAFTEFAKKLLIMMAMLLVHSMIKIIS